MPKTVIRTQTISFRRMEDGTETDYAFLHKLERSLISSKPRRIISALKTLNNSLKGYQVSCLEHSLKTVTLAKQDSLDIELTIAAVIHGISHDLALEKHSQMVPAIIRPYVYAEVTWILETHGIFQMYYYADKVGQNADERKRWQGHLWFASCKRLCHDWGQVSFFLDFVSKPLSHFIPIINDIFFWPAFVPHIKTPDALGQQPDRL